MWVWPMYALPSGIVVVVVGCWLYLVLGWVTEDSSRLQSVQNAAAWLVTGARRCDHITPILRQLGLHWLPVRQRVLFKIAVLVFQCLVGQAPSYLSDDCQPVSDSRPRRLRSSDSLVRRAHNTYGDRCFATAGPRVWKSLPAETLELSSTELLNCSIR